MPLASGKAENSSACTGYSTSQHQGRLAKVAKRRVSFSRPLSLTRSRVRTSRGSMPCSGCQSLSNWQALVSMTSVFRLLQRWSAFARCEQMLGWWWWWWWWWWRRRWWWWRRRWWFDAAVNALAEDTNKQVAAASRSSKPCT